MAKNHNRIRLSSLTEEEKRLIYMHSIASDKDRQFVSDYLGISAARSGKLPIDSLIRF